MIVVFVVDTSPSMGEPVTVMSSSSTNNKMTLSKLDLAKMAVEDLTKGLTRRVHEHNVFLQHQPPDVQKSFVQMGLGYAPPNQYLLLSTSRQHDQNLATMACGAGGRLLVGFGPDNIYSTTNTTSSQDSNNNSNASQGGMASGNASDPLALHHNHHHGDGTMGGGSHANNTVSFQRELKQLQAAVWDPDSAAAAAAAAQQTKGASATKAVKPPTFPDDAGGAAGLNAALSAGLQLLSRYRLQDRATEHFGMGRLANPAMMTPTGTFAIHALQPACLILLTDGACLRKTNPAEGGGSLQLQYGSMPLREWYKEPFRWDQRIICLAIGGGNNNGSGGKETPSSSSSSTSTTTNNNTSTTSTQYLHPHLRALCEVTGGYHTMLQSTASLQVVTERLLRILVPPLPRQLPVSDPLKSPVTTIATANSKMVTNTGSSSFVNAGPVCCFQSLEGDMDGTGGGSGSGMVYRAMLLYVPSPAPLLTPTDVPETVFFAPPLWCIPENYFPSKKLDTLPPRPAQPLLMISRFPSKLGQKSFEPTILMKQLHRLDQLLLSTRQLQQSATTTIAGAATTIQPGATVKLLHRDVYICEWVDDRPAKAPQPNVYGGSEYFPVMVQDAGRPDDTTAGGGAGGNNYFHIGILHAPASTSTLASSTMSASSRPFSTLTLLPPEPQILVPLLLRACDAEHRALKKAIAATQSTSSASSSTTTTTATTTAEALAAVSRTVHIDEAWKHDFRNYLARLPPYYQLAMKRGLRPVLPTSLHAFLATALASEPATTGPGAAAAAVGGAGSVGDTALSATSSIASMPLQCFSKACFQKIRNAEQISRDTNERLERQEAELRGVSKLVIDFPSTVSPQQQQSSSAASRPQLHRSTSGGISGGSGLEVGYGQYDPRSSTESFLSSLRTLPAPWLVGVDSNKNQRKQQEGRQDTTATQQKDNHGVKADAIKSSAANEIQKDVASNSIYGRRRKRRNAMECLGDLPANCLMAYYESRRRWIFGGSGLTTRGLMVEGVSNDGSNVQRCGANPNEFKDQPLLSLAGVGVSTLNETTVAKMGDYRERLLWSRSPVVGYGSNDSCGVAATTAADGSPRWSVDDDAMPMTFFDPKTGEFADSVQARVRSRLMVNFGNAFKEKRADALVPEKYLSQCPANHQHTNMGESSPPHGSPPHDSYSSSVEEGEAIFTKSPPPKSPPHTSNLSLSPRPPPVRPPPPKNDSSDSGNTNSAHTSETVDAASASSLSPPPPPPTKRLKTEGEFNKTLKQTPIQQRIKARGDRAASESIPATPTTPPVAPPKLKSSPGSTPGAGPSPKPPPPPLKSPVPPPPKGAVPKRPPPPPAIKRPPPPPSLDKRPSFSLAPSKPLPCLPLKRPSSFGSLSSSPADTGEGSKKFPTPPNMPKPTRLEPATSGGSTGSASSSSSSKPAPPIVQKQQAPPPAPKPRSGSIVSAPPPPPKPLDYTNKDKKPIVDLPAGWMCVWSKSQKRWYFFDTRSNTSVWEWPPPGGAK